MRYDLTDLQLFVNVIDAGTISAGATATFMTPASASERIKGMEDALGRPLLLRSKKGVSLTDAGAAVLRHARLILQQVSRMQGEMQDFGDGAKAHVRLLCNTSAVTAHLPQAIGAFLRAHPSISVDLEERPSPEIADAIREGVCDLGVLSDAADTAGLEALPFRADPLVLVVPKDHVLARQENLCMADVLDGEFIGLGEDSALQQLVTRQLRRLGKRVSYRVRLRSLEGVCTLVGEGVGVAIVPKAVAVHRGRNAGTRHIVLTDAWTHRKLMICMRNRAQLPSHTDKLLTYLLQLGDSGSENRRIASPSMVEPAR